jgi:hypothetical protein
MSAHQGIYACRITVDRQTADILREESKLVLVFNHETFEDFSNFTPVDQEALADIFCDAIAVIKAVGWEPEPDGVEQFEISLTAGHIEQLRKRREDLDAFIRDLLWDLEQTETDEEAAAVVRVVARAEVEGVAESHRPVTIPKRPDAAGGRQGRSKGAPLGRPSP